MTRTITITVDTTPAIESTIQEMTRTGCTSEGAAATLLQWMYQACIHNPAMGFNDSIKSKVL